jgi:molybdate transport system substrate-binding protein
MKRIISVIIAALSLFSGCLPSFAGPAVEITVSAAMSLKDTFEDAARAYEAKNPGTKILLNFGSSGDLARQIEGGAPVDVFASAAQKDMDAVAGKGLMLQNSRLNFATNSVALIVPVNSGSRLNSFEGLASSRIRKIAVGDFKMVPAGRYTEEVLNYYRLMPAVSDKLIFAGNVRQVLDYVARGEVDAGVVYSTDAKIRAAEVRVVATAPEASHKAVIYPVAVVKGSRKEAAARGFITFILSPEGKKILEKYGFK